ncbi:hypothetical protein FA13DRAFT_1089666 [Coprinellus micaceus]|uniref:DUF6533 domain-containing protein n=1 Tax=Coprinellus micaceus TaxID=71717 RepID=A0A4Y7TRS6_COPMI|nr:hypothetical protein FA13DRAFT_1089666 [Coprinellus micaceus]
MSLADAVATWRLQEGIQLSFYTLYVYYYATTLDEEVASVHPQKWRLGKILFMTLRYLTFVIILLDLIKNYRTYLVISPTGCKVLLVMYQILRRLVSIAADVSVGLVLCALLGAKKWTFIIIMFFCTVPPVVNLLFNAIGFIQVPGEMCSVLYRPELIKRPFLASPIGRLDIYLGYPCYLVDPKDFAVTKGNLGIEARSYIGFVRTALMFILAIVTAIYRYQHQTGKLLTVLRRDGGLYYLASVLTKLFGAILDTPNLADREDIMASPAYTILISLSQVVVPILAQRLLLNLRSSDHMLETRQVASSLMFAKSDRVATVPEDDIYDLSETTYNERSTPSRQTTSA